TESDCNDGVDNDCDGLVDCADVAQCAGHSCSTACAAQLFCSMGGACVAPGPSICTTGTSFECGRSYTGGTDLVEHWTGTECCVTDPGVCTTGTSFECGRSGSGGTDLSEHWTGSGCCVSSVSACVSGSAFSCSGASQHWTGTL